MLVKVAEKYRSGYLSDVIHYAFKFPHSQNSNNYLDLLASQLCATGMQRQLKGKLAPSWFYIGDSNIPVMICNDGTDDSES